MSRLSANFKAQVDFIHIDWNDRGSAEVLQYFNVLRRSSYILIGPDGEVLWQFIGPLHYDTVAAEIEKAMSENQ